MNIRYDMYAQQDQRKKYLNKSFPQFRLICESYMVFSITAPTKTKKIRNFYLLFLNDFSNSKAERKQKKWLKSFQFYLKEI